MKHDDYITKVEEINDLFEEELNKLKKDFEEIQNDLFNAADIISYLMEGIALDYLDSLKNKPKREKKLKDKFVEMGKEIKTFTGGSIDHQLGGRFTPITIQEAVDGFFEANETLKKINKRISDYRDMLDGKKVLDKP